MKQKGDAVTTVVSMDCPVLRSCQARIKGSGLFTNRGWKLKSVALTENALVLPDGKILLSRISKVERVDLTPHCLLLEEFDKRRSYFSFQTDRELYDWHDDIYSRCPRIGTTTGSPFGFVHSVHVGFEPGSGSFTGLPSHWYDSLGISNPKRSQVALHGATAVTNPSSRRTSVSSTNPPLSPSTRNFKIPIQPTPAFFENTIWHKKDGMFSWRWAPRWGVLGTDTLTISKSKMSAPIFILRMNNLTQIERSTDRPHALRVCFKSGEVHFLSFPSDREVHMWQDALYARSPLAGAVVGNPKDFAHRVHVGIDPQTGEFTGLPEQWQTVMLNLNVT